MKTNEFVVAKTHKDFLNELLGLNLGGYMKSSKKLDDGKLLTNGGRVLGVTAVAGSLKKAIKKAYKKVKKISFANAYYRKDIGQKALKAYGEK